MVDRVPQPLRSLGVAAAFAFGGFSRSQSLLRSPSEPYNQLLKPKVKLALPCGVCKGKGFYVCKLCKGGTTIRWSPMFDPVFINPCVCPTCDGNGVQRCLNCLSKGYA